MAPTGLELGGLVEVLERHTSVKMTNMRASLGVPYICTVAGGGGAGNPQRE